MSRFNIGSYTFEEVLRATMEFEYCCKMCDLDEAAIFHVCTVVESWLRKNYDSPRPLGVKELLERVELKREDRERFGLPTYVK